MPCPLLADAVLLVHFFVVIFVVGGLVVVVVGNLAGWSWVNSLWFRGAHVLAITFVVAESWLGLTCPFTTLEAWLRLQVGDVSHGQDFIAYWLRHMLFYAAPAWVFAAIYTVFGLLVATAWWHFPPGRRPRDDAKNT